LKKTFYILVSFAMTALLLVGCASNNCPLDNYVSCNYYFYDSEGNPVMFSDTLTVKTLLPGTKTEYYYRRLGYKTITLDYKNDSYLQNGYSIDSATVRRDTILVNKLTGKSNEQTSFSVPMSYFNSSDTLVFCYAGISLCDTIKVSHDSYPHVDLPECGTYRFHNLREINATDRYIDHIEISNKKVNYEGNENVKVYLNGTAE